MLEGARLLAGFSALLLLAAILVWAKLLDGPLLQRLDGSRVSNARPAALAARRILVAALGASAIAAVVAIAGWMIG